MATPSAGRRLRKLSPAAVLGIGLLLLVIALIFKGQEDHMRFDELSQGCGSYQSPKDAPQVGDDVSTANALLSYAHFYGRCAGPLKRAETFSKIYAAGYWVTLISGLGFLASGVYQLASSALASRASGLKTCPYCAEKVLVQARVCKHCGRDFA